MYYIPNIEIDFLKLMSIFSVKIYNIMPVDVTDTVYFADLLSSVSGTFSTNPPKTVCQQIILYIVYWLLVSTCILFFICILIEVISSESLYLYNEHIASIAGFISLVFFLAFCFLLGCVFCLEKNSS